MRPLQARGRGQAFFRSLEKMQARVDDNALYGIRRHGGWFRPGAHGYTDSIGAMGLFSGAEARKHLSAEGVSLIHANELKRIFNEMDFGDLRVSEVASFLKNKQEIDRNCKALKAVRDGKAASAVADAASSVSEPSQEPASDRAVAAPA